ncbi:MAG: PDZ domain-containing protein [Bacteroidales bacterium]|jgi:tricorn protease|nr:PDZ domain-containing protein [Bacteroidales bacterium]
MKYTVLIAIMIMMTHTANSQQEARLLRFPAVSANSIVFTYAGDLYSVGKTGGVARRITSGDGYEMFPRFSPDGKWIAFTGQYDGNTEVYLIPADGGIPKRLTHTATLGRDDISDRMGPNNIVMGWTPDGKKIIYRSRGTSFNDFIGKLYAVSVDGGLSEELPLSTGGFCSYNSDGSKLAFNRVFREFRTWKYYQGGMADDIRIFDYKTKSIEKITDTQAQDIMPMWIGNDIYFISDRDRTMNLFCYNTESKTTTKVTTFTEYDIKFPSHNNGEIVFENGGYIYLFNATTKKSEKVKILISNDMAYSRNFLADASKNIQAVSPAPGGERLVVSARGEVFSVPAKSGVTRNLTKKSSSHDRNAVWSPDGKTIAFISDRSGEFEIWTVAQDGSSEPVQITKKADTYYFSIEWSPDSKKLLFSDKKLRLRYVDVETKKVNEVASNGVWEYTDFAWSPDSKWIVFTEPQKSGMNQIMLFELATGKKTPVTDTWYESYNAQFSRDGKYLVFISDRDFNPIYSHTEWNTAYTNMARVYLVPLDAKTPNPLAPKNDEVVFEAEKKDEPKPAEGAAVSVVVTTEGIQERIVSLPIEASNYYGVEMTGDDVYYMKRGTGDDKTTLVLYSIDDSKETTIGEFDGFQITGNGKKMMLRKAKNYYMVDLPKAELKPEKNISFDQLKTTVNRQEEWAQIYFEVYRQMRDFFYVENMHGVDWNAMRDKYAALLPYVNNRHDLNYIIGELIGELNVGHAYISGGDCPMPKRVNTGLLGAVITSDPSGFFKVTSILKGANWSKELRSPLTEHGVNVKEGEYIIAIDGVKTNTVKDMYALLAGKADVQVEMLVNSKPSADGARKVIIVPLTSEASLYYYNWVQHNVELVNKATNGEVGYIHVPDMSVEGLNEFVKYFYPQLNKKALIIDDRGNGGGNVSPMIMERLMRIPTRANMARNVIVPGQTPTKLMLGPKVLLLNQYSASDGDLFPYAFKKHQLGKTIGMRSWGGVVGIRGSLPFVDGTVLNKPEFASYSIEESKWIIEGYGVEPDIIVDNDSYLEYSGTDTQLLKAIEIIKEELKKYTPIPEIPEAPDKSK